MVEISVSAEHSYVVNIGLDYSDELAKVTSRYAKVRIIAPSFLKDLLKLDHSDIFYTEDGEGQKSIETVEAIWKYLGEIQLGRKDAIVGIGGGATTDLAGFVAATWLRGVDWVAIPTTLAAMVDAAVGGKTGINTDAGKNLVGAFHSPSSVILDTSFLETLSDRDFAAGLAEVIKTGLIADESILELLDGCSDISDARKYSEELIAKSVAVKASVVSEDFKEGKLREILNFGHTFGHAIERRESYRLRHGEAVSIGLIYALYLSEELGGLDPEVTARTRDLLSKFTLPVMTMDLGWSDLLTLMQGDKKSRAQELRFIGLETISRPIWFESVPVEVAAKVYGRITQ
jgi:3-dehydroquinate synthase